MQSASAINEAELRSVSRSVTNGVEWRHYLASKKITGLTQLVSIQQGSLTDATGAERIPGYKKLVDDFLKWDDVSAETKAMDEEVVMDQIAELHAACRNRVKACMDRMNDSNGLKQTGKGQLTTIDPSTFWRGITPQRGGRPLNDRDRGSDKLVRQLGENLYDEGGRKLQEVMLHKLRSAEDEKAAQADSEDEDEEGGKEGKKKSGKKGGQVSKSALLHNILILLNSLAAVCTSTVKKESDITVDKGCGKVKIDGQGKTVLDCSLAEAQEFAWFLVLVCSAVEREKVQATFAAIWERVRMYVNENSEYGYTVASALQRARIDAQTAKSIASDVIQATKGGNDRNKETAPAKGGKGGKRKPEAAGKAAPPEKKAKANKKEDTKKPNSSGRLCWTYHTTGKCSFKDKCIHKHVAPGADSDGEDDRE